MAAILANITRGGEIESQHYGHIAVVDSAGRLLYSRGNPDFKTYIRSAAKPFQALPLFDDGIPQHFGLTPPEAAVMMASHNSEKRHLEAAASILRKIGCEPAQLLCGIHEPLSPKVAKEIAQSGSPLTVLHNNCSGKHAGMLAACRFHSWPAETYLEMNHPHQRRLLQVISDYSELATKEIGIGIDGCSAPNYALPLSGMAKMYAKLANSMSSTISNMVKIFIENAEMIGGEGRFDTEIMFASKKRVMAKTGAEGIQCLAIFDSGGHGIALKIVDGTRRAIPAIVTALLEKLELVPAEVCAAQTAVARRVLRNHRGIEIGEIQPVI